MSRVTRSLIALVLMLAVPLHAAAVGMVQVSPASAAMPDHSRAHSDAHHTAHEEHAGPSTDDPCEDSTLKCCHANAAWLDGPQCTWSVAISSFERHGFVARWTSFIPEDPSPPPIA